jgi:endonuclease/exonuclease/phosphatase family metal-dependent hydrolase
MSTDSTSPAKDTIWQTGLKRQIQQSVVYRRIFHPTSAQYTFFSAAHETLSRIDHILGHKANLSKYKKIEIIPCFLSDHNALKLELNNKTTAENTQTIGS